MRIDRIICDRCNQEHGGGQNGFLQIAVTNGPGVAQTLYCAGDMCDPCTNAMVKMLLSFKGDKFTGETTHQFERFVKERDL